MKLTKRRVTVGLISAAVVVGMTSATTWALASEKPNTTTAAADKPIRLVVGYKHGVNPTSGDAKIAAFGARRTATGAAQAALGELDATTVEVSSSRSAAAIASLKSDPNVAWVEADTVRKAFDRTPNDPEFIRQPEMRDVKLPAAWDTTTGSAVKVAVVDTGVTAAGDLQGAVTAGYDFINNDSSPTDDQGHGTFVAALIAARGGNGSGMAGVCWSCQIIPVKVLNHKGEGTSSTVAKGIVWAVQHGAKVINLSLGGPGSSKLLSDAVAYANMNSVLVVAAAGNEGGYSTEFDRQYPAALGDVVAVAATSTGTTSLAPFSSSNAPGDRWVDVAAPGIVRSMTRTGRGYVYEQGTSFSSPIVAGIAALVKSRNPNYTGWSLMNAIQSSTSAPVSGTNYGMVDASAALGVGTETTPPTSSGVSPGDNSLLHGTIAVRPVNVADNRSGIRNVTLHVDGVYKGYSRTAPYTINYNSAGRNGTVKLQVRVYDKAGNVLVLDRTIRVDNVAPAVRITSAPKNGAKISGRVSIGYTGSDANGMKLFQLILNGKVAQTHTGTSPFVFGASAVPKNVTVQVRGYDKANNAKDSTKFSYHR